MRIISSARLRDGTTHSTFLTERPENQADCVVWCFDCNREHRLWEIERLDLGKDLDYREPEDLWESFYQECLEMADATFKDLAVRFKGTGIRISALVTPWSVPDDQW